MKRHIITLRPSGESCVADIDDQGVVMACSECLEYQDIDAIMRRIVDIADVDTQPETIVMEYDIMHPADYDYSRHAHRWSWC